MASIFKKQLTARVIRLLTRHPEYRDNDDRLRGHVWRAEMHQRHGISLGDISTEEFIRDYLIPKKVSDCESIRRTRQKTQQHTPELRGTKRRYREAKAVEVRKSVAGDPWRPNEDETR